MPSYGESELSASAVIELSVGTHCVASIHFYSAVDGADSSVDYSDDVVAT